MFGLVTLGCVVQKVVQGESKTVLVGNFDQHEKELNMVFSLKQTWLWSQLKLWGQKEVHMPSKKLFQSLLIRNEKKVVSCQICKLTKYL
jgi:hypothetical protein